ncbi:MULTISPECIES: acetate--CoA ligase family protein [unclassified Haladaptatus]|uniref:acetate--CoA ligase family protein n=1 Tax=unclassified Haladaptatus TaxID=2622732 RepID=UPI0023E7575D|nr:MULTISPECIES: acetate--CoA ligase family protein [unclassified Haladaptatus]
MTAANSTVRERPADLSRMLDPDSVAVVGASNEPGKRGYQTILDLEDAGFDGEIYPVNPKYDEIRGREVYESVASLPAAVDLAFIATPASTIPSIVADCGRADVAGAVIIAAGFSEVGEQDLETRVLETAREHGVRIIGPNIQGIANLHSGLNLLGGYDLPAGNLALLSQSGNVGLEFGSHANVLGDVGFSLSIGIGNETDLRFDEYLPYLDDHDQTDAIVLYVDGMEDGRQFLRAARETVTETPIVVVKGGVTDAGQRSAASHTGSLAGEGAVVDAAYRQAGVVRAERSDEAIAIANALANLPPAAGENVAILTDGGGNATLGADALINRGLSVPKLTDETQARLRELVPDAPNLSNPVDMMGLQGDGDLSIFYEFAKILVEDPNVDALLLAGAFGAYETYGPGDSETDQEPAVARDIASLTETTSVPIVAQCIYGGEGSPALSAFESAGIPTFGSIDTAVTALEKVVQYGRHLDESARKSDFTFDSGATERPDECDGGATTTLSEYRSRKLLTEAGIEGAPYSLAASKAEAVAAAETFDGPVAMKVASPDIVHKTEANAVSLDVTGDAAVGEAYTDLVENARAYDPDAELEGVLLTPMLDEGTEFIVGVVRDPEVGPVVMFGVGGVFVEVLNDVAFRALPLTEFDARQLLDDIDAQSFLDGVRGGTGVDRTALVDLLLDVSDLIESHPDITELDLNPVFAYEDGAAIVDASVRLADRG